MSTFINKTGSIFILLTLLVSCSMDRYPLTDFGEDEFFTSEENAKLAIIGLYRGDMVFNEPEYTPKDWWGYGANVLLDGVTDIGYDRRGFTNPIGQITSGGLLADNNNTTPLYTAPFTRISACNRFLENIDRLGDSDEVLRMKSEARFIRATSYFYLTSYFHDVPLVKEPLTAEESNNVKKATRAEIIKFVVDELTEISELLPRHKDLPASELGRATSQAALVFLARTYMLNKEYKEAAAVCKTIIDWNENQLHDNYQTLFYPAGKSSSEHIFAVHLVDNLAGYALPQHAYPIKDAGWCLVNGSSHLYEAYEFRDGTPFSYEDARFNIDNLGADRDPRLDYTLIYNGATFRGSTYICHPETNSVDKIGAGQATQTGYLLRKFFDESWTGDLNRYGGITPIARYAEVLLMYLEAEMEAGTVITQTLLDKYYQCSKSPCGYA